MARVGTILLQGCALDASATAATSRCAEARQRTLYSSNRLQRHPWNGCTGTKIGAYETTPHLHAVRGPAGPVLGRGCVGAGPRHRQRTHHRRQRSGDRARLDRGARGRIVSVAAGAAVAQLARGRSTRRA